MVGDFAIDDKLEEQEEFVAREEGDDLHDQSLVVLTEAFEDEAPKRMVDFV